MRTTRIVFIILVAVFSLSTACSSTSTPPAPSTPVYTNLGSLHHAITTTSPEAQRYFDQGLTLSYAFNHAEGIRSYEQAAALDPSCAMCFWGVAYALGPNINAPITEEAAAGAWKAIGRARELMANVTEKERAYIDALSKRYSADPKADRAPLDRAYADAMREVARRFPDDPDAATLYAQSLMDTSPWNYWDAAGKPHPLTESVLTSLEGVLSKWPDHIGAIHFYIHAVEASDNPGRAEKFADRLPVLTPGAGHLVHMPAHIYLRVGRFGDATAANESAIRADDQYFSGDRVASNPVYEMGYRPHNMHFIATTAGMEGRRTRAIEAARMTRTFSHEEMWRDPAMGGMMQHFALTPLYTMVRFAMWDEVLAEPAPADDLPFMNAIWHMAQGLAHAGQGRVADAEKQLAALALLRKEPALEEMWISSANVASSIVAIAHEVLAGEVALRRKQVGVSARHFAEAAALESGLTYMEPPDWPLPARHLQGTALLDLGLPAEAEVAFRADLQKFPDNGWSLSGLQASLERQKKAAEAAEMAARLARAWTGADTTVVAGRPQSGSNTVVSR